MSILTDYFIADPQQLAIVFAGWLTVVNEPVVREVKNPFTGQTQRVKEWPPGKPVSDDEPAHSPDLSNLPHVQLKNIDQVKIATLNNILTSTPVRDALDAFLKPVLVHPKNEDIGLNKLPKQLTAALRSLSDDAAEITAKKWQQTEEMQSDQFTSNDCKDVLRSLRGLAQSCKASQRMYLLWSL
jgi:hypothetical protein